ncbi:hypothetical protein GQX74_007352 [Glossina fuscipes]|nr:hypothetical protein GQX74_007352 [Glossina fuscipes]
MNKKIGILLLICINLLTINADPEEIQVDKLIEAINQTNWGLRCVTEMSLEIEDAAGDFSNDLTLCEGSNATNDHLVIVQLANDVATQTSKLLEVNDEVCKNSASMADWDGSLKPSKSCVERFTKELQRMSELFEDILQAIKKTKTTYICPVIAMTKFAASQTIDSPNQANHTYVASSNCKGIWKNKMNKKIGIVMLISINLLAINGEEKVDPGKQNFLGLHCVSEVIPDIQDAIGDLIMDLELCDDPNTMNDYMDIVYKADDIARLTTKLLRAHDQCKDTASLSQVYGLLRPSKYCLYKFKKQLYKTDEAFEEISIDIQNAKKDNSCAIAALNQFVTSLKNAKERILSCPGVSQNLRKVDQKNNY